MSLLVGCGHSEAELEQAYRDGHRAAIIWCKRTSPPEEPDLDAPLLESWQQGWAEAVSQQCPRKAQPSA